MSVLARPGKNGAGWALVRAMADMRLVPGSLVWVAKAGTPQGLPFDPGWGGLVAGRLWLQARWRALSAVAVAKRRKGFLPARAGLDWELARRMLRAPLGPAPLGALLTVMVGDTVSATRAWH